MIQTIIQILILTVNITSLVAFGIDKLNSKKRAHRIPESNLLALAFFGPFGALAGMLFLGTKHVK